MFCAFSKPVEGSRSTVYGALTDCGAAVRPRVGSFLKKNYFIASDQTPEAGDYIQAEQKPPLLANPKEVKLTPGSRISLVETSKQHDG